MYLENQMEKLSLFCPLTVLTYMRNYSLQKEALKIRIPCLLNGKITIHQEGS